MKHTMLEKPIQLQGQIERITFQNEDNNYIVAKIKVDKTQNLVTIVGNIIDPCPGEILIMQGNGDYDAAKKIVNARGNIRPELQKDLDRISEAGIPRDIIFNQGSSVLGL